jgi:hypothetical protein
VVECRGVLVVHLDGSMAACTEELLGRPCAGEAHRDRTTCEAVLGSGGCEHCEVVFDAEVIVADVAASVGGGPCRAVVARPRDAATRAAPRESLGTRGCAEPSG